MKLNRKWIMVLALVMSMAMATGGTLAYLTDRDSEANVFTMGNVEIDLNEEFEQGSELIPGVEIEKEPTITNTGRNDAWVWATVAVPAGLEKGVEITWAEAGWTKHGDTTTVEVEGKNYTLYTYLYNEALAPDETTETPVMSSIKMLNNVDIAPDGTLNTVVDGVATPVEWNINNDGNPTVYVSAYAIQTEGFATVQDGYNAYTTQWGDNGAEYENPADDETDNLVGNWASVADTSWYNETDTEFTLTTAEGLAGLAELVNAGNTFSKKTVTLDSNINLAGREWTPIGNSTYKFQGTFDGNSKTISNLTITGNKSYVGLFGYTTNGTIKNVTVDNATVSGYVGVGVVAGSPYTSKYENIKVTGLVKVDGLSYVGGVGGRNAYADWTNITVDVDAGSYVKANSIEDGTAYRTYVGGVVGFMGEGKHTMENVTSNIDVYGTTCDVGGIIGIAHYGNSFINCSSSGNVTITDATEAGDAEEIGGIAGVWHNGGADVTFDGCTYTGKLSTNITEGVDLTDNTIHGSAYSATGSGNVIVK